MKSPWLGILCLFASLQGSFAQDSPPQSPSVASLMRFEEYPVDHYTGIPQISIPVYSLPTRSKDITINIGLNYHASSVATFNEKSGTAAGAGTLQVAAQFIVLLLVILMKLPGQKTLLLKAAIFINLIF